MNLSINGPSGFSVFLQRFGTDEMLTETELLTPEEVK